MNSHIALKKLLAIVKGMPPRRYKPKAYPAYKRLQKPKVVHKRPEKPKANAVKNFKGWTPLEIRRYFTQNPKIRGFKVTEKQGKMVVFHPKKKISFEIPLKKGKADKVKTVSVKVAVEAQKALISYFTLSSKRTTRKK
jgi:hypothetical protein